ncbi:beta-galactosidase [Bacillus licheniformis]|nr:beta-galactosidase [Bacillus licheniformis]
MGTYAGLNYWKFADLLDVISWDSYPAWHNSRQEDSRLGADIALFMTSIALLKAPAVHADGKHAEHDELAGCQQAEAPRYA